MTRNRMTEMLAETLCVPAGEASAALEAREWNLLEAARLLQDRSRARQLEAARALRERPRGGVVRDIVDWFVARRAASSETPVSAATLAPLFLISSGSTVR